MDTTDTRRPSAFMCMALGLIALVWLASAWFNFTEQARLAETLGFSEPMLAPLMLDGLAVALASLAFAASLDGRAALYARFGTVVALLASSATSGYAAYRRTYQVVPTADRYTVEQADLPTVIFGALTPLVVLLAFEAILMEMRRIVQKWRGRTSPVPIPVPRATAWLLSPWETFLHFRRVALAQCRAEMMVEAPAVEPPHVEVEVTQAPRPRRAVMAARSEPTADLVEVARDVYRDLDVRTITAFRDGIRARGCSVSNSAAGPLLRRLRDEEGAP